VEWKNKSNKNEMDVNIIQGTNNFKLSRYAMAEKNI
jgi:hypothetical protein